ncbi:unnamed protein product [Allacma fusca]|uniref:Uncharacterized protein n=1 Tax=Allacma fusca TaxID=39272 RepID=A0A8J2K9B1_9HEXA|nr:unnamed protein product [Allacma fusca]
MSSSIFSTNSWSSISLNLILRVTNYQQRPCHGLLGCCRAFHQSTRVRLHDLPLDIHLHFVQHQLQLLAECFDLRVQKNWQKSRAAVRNDSHLQANANSEYAGELNSRSQEFIRLLKDSMGVGGKMQVKALSPIGVQVGSIFVIKRFTALAIIYIVSNITWNCLLLQ